MRCRITTASKLSDKAGDTIRRAGSRPDIVGADRDATRCILFKSSIAARPRKNSGLVECSCLNVVPQHKLDFIGRYRSTSRQGRLRSISSLQREMGWTTRWVDFRDRNQHSLGATS
jgi:hypothetical protein